MHSNMPHEFFTPLGGIIGLIEVLRSDFDNYRKEDVQDILKDIHYSALRLHRTLRNYLLLLDLKTLSPDAVLAIGTLGSRDLKDAVTTGVKAAAQRHERPEDVLTKVEECTIHANPNDVTMIVEELTDNACNYSRRATPIDIRLTREGILTVTDKGRGMPAEEIEQIGAFQQMDRKKHQQQGLGLGLVLVQKLAAACGAKFSIESALGQGTTVQVAFKLASPAS